MARTCSLLSALATTVALVAGATGAPAFELRGRVLDDATGAPAAGATVVASEGVRSWRTTPSAACGGAPTEAPWHVEAHPTPHPLAPVPDPWPCFASLALVGMTRRSIPPRLGRESEASGRIRARARPRCQDSAPGPARPGNRMRRASSARLKRASC